ncbi:MAG: hypothetical protein C0605_11910 [Hyphomicrobiales bacterium]|nr:MAG: hypothetical protein C0605_11910 [Hyphomicrobiales bacterium]
MSQKLRLAPSLFLALMFLAGLSLPAVRATNNTPPVKSLCDYSFQDLSKIRQQYEALFPRGMKLDAAKALLKKLGASEIDKWPMFEYRWWVVIWQLDFWELFLFIGSPENITNDKDLTIGNFECHPGKGLTTKWYMLLTSSKGQIERRELAVYLEDQNFASRGIDLKPGLFWGYDNCRLAIRSLTKTRKYGNWDLLKPYLIAAGFKLDTEYEKGAQEEFPVYVIMPDNKYLKYHGLMNIFVEDITHFMIRMTVDPHTRRVIAVN